MKKPIKKMRKDRVYFRLAGGDNIINCRVDHKTHKVTKTKMCRFMTLDGDEPICYYRYIDEL